MLSKEDNPNYVNLWSSCYMSPKVLGFKGTKEFVSFLATFHLKGLRETCGPCGSGVQNLPY